jgi:hypothetical protein
VQRAAPDGRTLMVTSTGDIMGLAGHRGERPFAVRDELPPIIVSFCRAGPCHHRASEPWEA